MNKFKFNGLQKKINNAVQIHYWYNLQKDKFPLSGKFGQPRKKKRALCWSIYCILLVHGLAQGNND